MKWGNELLTGRYEECLEDILTRYHYARAMVIRDANVKVKINSIYEMEIRVEKEPTYDFAREKTGIARMHYERKKWDVMIAIGGGSVLDTAKVVSVMLTNTGEPIRYRGFDEINKRGVPLILVPTTLSGSDGTDNASLVDEDTKTKMGINGAYMMAEYVIHDYRLLVPSSKAYASTYLDALVHAVESKHSPRANEQTKEWSQKAIDLLLTEEPKKLQLGAYLAGKALCNSGSGYCGALSYALGVNYNVPHGIAGGIWLPDFAREKKETAVAEKAEEILSQYAISTYLEDYGVDEMFLQNEIVKTVNRDDIINKHWRKSCQDGNGSGKKKEKKLQTSSPKTAESLLRMGSTRLESDTMSGSSKNY